MRRLTRCLAVLGAVSGMVLAGSSAAISSPAISSAADASAAGSSTVGSKTSRPSEKGIDCVVQYVDERDEIIRTGTAPEGQVYGQFDCVRGQWVFAWDRGRTDKAIAADEIRIDPSGAVSVRRFTGPALGNDLTLGEITAIAQAVTGSREVTVDRAIVAVDDGKERTPEEIEALLAGKDTTGVRVLDTIEKPDPAKSTKDVIDEAGGTPESTVVYLSLWGAIKSVFAWVADTIHDIGEWLDRHCDWAPSPNGLGVVIVCRW
ncbi:hypothetical protein ABNF97_29060 [Plantactinospora sp. B6F1]|uniref:hypothetical protein n=1 Tax=Plantactinospora sp. B6F1 TaxID=3158971 RepID=UPI0032D935DB